MAAISPQGNIMMLGSFTTTVDVDKARAELDAGNVLALADSEAELRELAHRVKLGAKELERRNARRKQQKASRKLNR